MIPLTIDKKELKILVAQSRAVADAIIQKADSKVTYMMGTMIEIPRAALLADDIAEVAEFFSFGTNDLTQMTLGLSRDDAGRFLPDYVKAEKEGGKAIFGTDPFVSIDQSGVGKLVKMGIAGGRSTRKHLKVGICGEHGGEAKSVKFCHSVGMNYVSCSPYRVPIARLAAAQAVIEEKAAAKVAAQAPAIKAKKAPAKAAAKPEAKAPKAKAKAKPAKAAAAVEMKPKRGRPAAQKVESPKGSKVVKAAKPAAKAAAKPTVKAKAAPKPAAKVVGRKAAPKKAVSEVKSTRGRKPAAKVAAPKAAPKPVKKPAATAPAKRSVGRPKGSAKKA